MSSGVATSPSKSFFGSFSKLKNKIVSARAMSNLKRSQISAGLRALNNEPLLLFLSGTDYARVDQHLQHYYNGLTLIVDIGRILRDNDCPDNIFASEYTQKLEFGNNTDTLDGLMSVASAMRSWWAASPHNVVVLICDPEVAFRISVCALIYANIFGTVDECCRSVLTAGVSGGVLSRQVVPSDRRFIKEFDMILSHDRSLPTPTLSLKEVIIHKVPQFDDIGCRLVVIIIQGGRFLYDSMRAEGGEVIVPTCANQPMTLLLPVNVEITGPAIIKAFHKPDSPDAFIPRELLFSINFHTGLCAIEKLNNTLLYTKNEINTSANNPFYHKSFRVELIFDKRGETLAAASEPRHSDSFSNSSFLAHSSPSHSVISCRTTISTTITTDTTIITTPIGSDGLSSPPSFQSSKAKSTAEDEDSKADHERKEAAAQVVPDEKELQATEELESQEAETEATRPKRRSLSVDLDHEGDMDSRISPVILTAVPSTSDTKEAAQSQSSPLRSGSLSSPVRTTPSNYYNGVRPRGNSLPSRPSSRTPQAAASPSLARRATHPAVSRQTIHLSTSSSSPVDSRSRSHSPMHPLSRVNPNMGPRVSHYYSLPGSPARNASEAPRPHSPTLNGTPLYARWSNGHFEDNVLPPSQDSTSTASGSASRVRFMSTPTASSQEHHPLYPQSSFLTLLGPNAILPGLAPPVAQPVAHRAEQDSKESGSGFDSLRRRFLTMGRPQAPPVAPAPPEVNENGEPLTEDELVARQLQAQFDMENQQILNYQALVQAQGQLDPDRMTYEETMAFQEFMGHHEDEARRRGASKQQINQLPEFECTGGKFLGDECLICKDNFEVGQMLRTLPCFHNYHVDCVDTWLNVNKSCPLCHRNIDE